MIRRTDDIADFLFNNQYPCPSGQTDTRAILDALNCAEINEPPVEQYDMAIFEGDTDQKCRRAMVTGTLAYVATRLEGGEYNELECANISERVEALRKRLAQ